MAIIDKTIMKVKLSNEELKKAMYHLANEIIKEPGQCGLFLDDMRESAKNDGLSKNETDAAIMGATIGFFIDNFLNNMNFFVMEREEEIFSSSKVVNLQERKRKTVK